MRVFWSPFELKDFSWLLDHVTKNYFYVTIYLAKAEQIHKITTTFTQKGPGGKKLSFCGKIVVILWICSSLSLTEWRNGVDLGDFQVKF